MLLRKLAIAGLITTTTEQIRITDSGKPHRYRLSLEGYDASMKGRLTSEERVERYFAASFELEKIIEA